MTRYAQGTSVSIEKSRAEIEAILKRYGASHFGYMSNPGKATIAFRVKDRNIRFDLPFPDRKDFAMPPKNYRLRTPQQIDEFHEQACKERWRALVLCIKAKLEAVASAIETFEEAFLAHIVLPDGDTVYEKTQANIALAYKGSNVPMLPAPGRLS